MSAEARVRARLESGGQPRPFIEGFVAGLDVARNGYGFVRESDIEPVGRVPRLPEDGEPAPAGEMSRTVAITLNGGLGTTMGMRAPKALLYAVDGMTFLDIALRQAERVGAEPLLMNSFATDRSVRAVLGDRNTRMLLQHRAPKLRRSDLHPARHPADPDLEWCPPGHGDVYTALAASGELSRLRAEGFRYAFISNVDNVGGSPDPRMLGFFLRSGAPFLVEVVRRLPSDRKGGHLARRRSDGRLLLRETAQCAAEDRRRFLDADRHRFFNANNLWVRLDALDEALALNGGFLPLPTIVNPKTVDPRDPSSTEVFHLEQAAGSAIQAIEGAIAAEAPRRRFAPVKTTENLLVLRSDVYRVDADGGVEPVREPPSVELDPRWYGFLSDLETRFPHGPPSLRGCDRLQVSGNVRFGKDVACDGEVTVVGDPSRLAAVPDGSRLSGTVRL